MRRSLVSLVLLYTFALLRPLAASAITLATLPVGNPGNANDGHNSFLYGGVAYSYRIGTYDVTIGQYAAFLNAVAATDTYGLYNTLMGTDQNVAGISRNGASGSYSYGVIGSPNRPIVYVSWGDAARFANWLSNGQPTGGETLSTTEDGSYFLNGATSNAALNAVTRKGTATWVLPTESEWYKATYYNSGTSSYYVYPYSSDTAPISAMPGGTPNTGNFTGGGGAYAVTGSSSYDPHQNYLTDVGAYTASASPSGAFDMGGEVLQWTEALSSSQRVARGGAWSSASFYLQSLNRTGGNPSNENDIIGFRMAFVGTILQPGDYNKDNHVNAADIKALEIALTDLSTYKSMYGVSDADLVQINQLPGESTSVLNNSDLQALLNYLKNGHGSADPVPEPTTLVLLGVGGLALMSCGLDRLLKLRSRRVLRARNRACLTGSVAVEMLNRRGMAPNDIVNGHAEHGGDFLPLGGAGRPAAQKNCFHALLLQSRLLDKLLETEILCDAKFGDGLRHRGIL